MRGRAARESGTEKVTRKAGCQVGGGDNGRGRVEIPGRGSGRGRARLGFVGTRPSLRFENGKRGRAGESEEPEKPEEPGLRSERIQSSLPPRYLGEINGKNREPAGEGRGGRTECEKVRTDVEGRGTRGEGETGKQARAPAPLRTGPPQRPAAFPAALGPAPQSGPYRPRGGSGEIPSWGLLVPEQVCNLCIPRTLASTRVQSLQSRRSPGQIRSRTRARQGPTSLLCCPPKQGPGSQETLTQMAVHQRVP